MVASFIITLREGLEAALIVCIALGYLAKLRRRDAVPFVWWGVLAAVVASLVTAWAFETLAGGFEGRSEEIFEGVVMLAAVAVLTSMVLWMQRQSRGLRREIEQQVESALRVGRLAGLSSLAFLGVYREGVETVLFLKAAFLATGGAGAWLGALGGLGGAVLLALLFYRMAVRLDLRKFFVVTGTLLLLLAAGLFAHGVHELQEAGVLPILAGQVWDTNHILDERGLVGSFLKALFGYNGNPSGLEVLVWLGYLAVFGVGYYRAVGAGPAVPPGGRPTRA